MPKTKIAISVMDTREFQDFLARVQEFVREYAWHQPDCPAASPYADVACTCGYDEALAGLA